MSDRRQVALGALLHAVGRLRMRAGAKLPDLHELSRELGLDESSIEAAYTAATLREHLGWVDLSFATRFLNPSTPLEHLIAVARAASLGDIASEPAGEERIASARLEPTLVRVRTEGARAPRDAVHLPLRRLSFGAADLDSAAGDGPTSGSLSQTEYLDVVWEPLIRGLEALPRESNQAITAALSLLERVTPRVPASATAPVCDLGYVDYCRLAAAVATVLFVELVEGKIEEDRALITALEDSETPRMDLWELAIAGEDSLFESLSAQVGPAAIGGRVIWLSLLIEELVARVLSTLDLPATSVLHQSDRGALLLLPPSSAAQVEALLGEFDLALFEMGGGRIAIARAKVGMGLADLRGGRLSTRWDELGAARELSRQQPFANLLARAHGHETVFAAPVAVAGRCPSCGRSVEAADGGDCGQCQRFVALGKGAARATALARVPFSAQARAEKALREAGARPVAGATFPELDVAYVLTSELPAKPLESDLAASLLSLRPDTEVAGSGAKRRIGLVLPPRRGGEQPCDSLAAVAKGTRAWGVVAFSLDQGAALAERGLAESDRSLSRSLGLKRAMHHFFAGFAAAMAVRDDAVHVVRAGENTLWAVAPWDHLPGLALAIRDAWHRYTGGNAELGLCAAAAFAPEGAMVSDVLEDVGRGLSRARALERKEGRSHDAVDLFGGPLCWADAALAAEVAYELAEVAPSTREPLLAALLSLGIGAAAAARAGSLDAVQLAASRSRLSWRLLDRLGRLSNRGGVDDAVVQRFRQALLRDDWQEHRHELPLTEIARAAVQWCRLLTEQRRAA